MAGIKETKELLRNQVLDLYKRFTAVKPEELLSGEKNEEQLRAHANLANELSKKIETLACLATVEEMQVIVPLVPEIKPQENLVPGISFVEAPPPVPEVKQPEPVFVLDKNIPLVPEVKQPEVVSNEKNPPAPEIKKAEVIPPVQPTAKTFPDLKSFIGLNEKLMFVRSLFKGAGSDYENVVAQLNNCTSYKEAETILKHLSFANKWSAEDEPVQIFYSIVKRRFA
jgi:hypothetical protein